MAVYQKTTMKRARPTTKRLMEQANALSKALEAIKKLVPQVAKIEADFDIDLVDGITKENRLGKLGFEMGTRKKHAGDMVTPPCWRCGKEMTPSDRKADGELNGKLFDPVLNEWVAES